MQRFLGLVLLLFVAMPFGLSVAGCGHKNTIVYCSGDLESGPSTGQVQSITLASNLAVSGESLNYGQIGTGLNASAEDCNGAAVSLTNITFASTDLTIADVNPSNGSVCAGSWNRNTGGGVANYTICTPPAAGTTKHVAYITASASGATSNPIAVYIHAPVTAVSLGSPDVTQAACDADPASNCQTSNGLVCDQSSTGTSLQFPAYDGMSCVSQTQTRQLTARVYDAQGNNITCQVGPVNFALQGATNVASINAEGFATATQPGSALLTATVSNSSSALNSGYFSTCPPASIVLTAVNQPAGATDINVALNTPQSFNATVFDTDKDSTHPNGYPITGLSLEFNSTLPVNLPAFSGAVTPAFPGTATITAVCNPGSCNPAPFSQIGVNGNGKPVTSNGITVTATGTSASVLYMASTPSTATVNGNTVTNLGSQYIVSEDFTTGQLASPVKLPFVPNSMVISQDGSTLYLGSSQALMVVNTNANTLANAFPTVQGAVLAVAPNNSYAVVTDPTRQTISLITSGGAAFTTFNGVGTRAAWTPDSSTLYVTTNTDQLLTYSTFTGWESTTLDQPYNDVAVTVPAVGAYFAGNPTEGRSYCAVTTVNAATATSIPTAHNVFSPLADQKSVPTDRLTATTDGKHILGATAAAPAAIEDFAVTLPVEGGCPIAPTQPQVTPGYFSSTPTTHPFTGITANLITGVVAASNSGTAFVTYTGAGGVLPLYQPATGLITNIPLSGGATAPVAGVYSSDDTTFYAGTSGDNQVHVIGVNGASTKDTGVITPNLPDPNGGIATPNLLAQRVRRSTS